VSESLVYLYAVLGAPLDAEIVGIDGQPVWWVNTQGLAAAVSDVPAADFEEEPLNANVREMSWLGPRAVAHQDVNARLFEAVEAVVPLAFGTVFRDDERVRQLLTDQATELSAQLERVRGCAEWVVALHLLREPNAQEVAAASPAVRALRAEIEASSPGRAHLLRRQLAIVERDESKRVQVEAAGKVVDALKAAAVDVFREPLPSDTVERPLLRASVLVRRTAEAEFLDEVDRLRTRWPEPTYRLLLTGPWPAYRFGGLAADDD
jgi:Gas vesicle synthesis protein GvpL/GvpF